MGIYNRKAPITYILLFLNIVYFIVVEWYASGTSTEKMIELGAVYAPYILERGEYFRFVTSMFMHFDISHIANNMLILFLLGDNVERAYGSVKYALVYLFSGIGAGVISWYIRYMLLHEIYVGAGASGAIFGIIGALLYAVLRNRGRLEDMSSNKLLLMLGLSFYHGISNGGVDNIAHIAGFISGFVISILLYKKKADIDL